MKTTATQFSANTLRSSSGNMRKICGVCVNPSPMERDRAAILIFLCEYPQRLIICTPDTTMEPNIISVQPPRTASGSDAKMTPSAGMSPARTMMTAPLAMAFLFTTCVMAISPTFWLKDVIGKHPKREDAAETNPSTAMEPDISLSFASRLNPMAASAEVSPSVSVADTRKIRNTEKMAS